MMHKLSRHMVLFSKYWYPPHTGTMTERLTRFMAAYSGTDPKYYTDHELWRIVVDVVRDVGDLNEVCNLMRDWFTGLPFHNRHQVDAEEALTSMISSLGLMRVDEFDFDLGKPDPRILKEMQQILDGEVAAFLRTLVPDRPEGDEDETD